MIHRQQDVLDLWFPDTGHEASPETHGAFWDERMQGGMDARIIQDFAGLTEASQESTSCCVAPDSEKPS